MGQIAFRHVSVFVLRMQEDGMHVLLLRRTQTLIGVWCQIAGKIETGETAWAAALREVYEETNITLDTLWSADFCEQFYEAQHDRIVIAPVFISIVPKDTQVVINDEHDAYQWVTIDQAIDLVSFPGQKEALQKIDTFFVRQTPPDLLKIDLSSSA